MELRTFFREHPKVALGFSGGVDSSYLLYAAREYGAEIGAYFIKSQFQPDFELADAKRLAEQVGTELRILKCDILAEQSVRENPQDRCYYCKNRIFGLLAEAADEAADRPGMKALAEMEVLSPLRMCGITKARVRELSKEAGLFTWDKPAYACLATRIPSGTLITEADLKRVEGAEAELEALGFRDFRVRVFGGAARLQLCGGQMERALEKRNEIKAKLKPYFDIVLLDLEER